MGISFETLCMKYEEKIKQALGIAGVYTEVYSFQQQAKKESPGFQIDMLIDRADQIIELCEMKFYGSAISLTQKDVETLRDRKARFQQQTGTKKNVMVLFASVNVAELIPTDCVYVIVAFVSSVVLIVVI